MVAWAVLKHPFVLNPAVFESAPAIYIPADFWPRLLNDESLRDFDDLAKLVIGCELIAALDGMEVQPRK
jgi:hypothetical protein